MNNEQIKEVLKSNTYKFLDDDKHLGENIILLTVGGSHAYGTNVETSDLDIRGISVELPSEIIGLGKFEQYQNKETDTTIYGLRKVLTLLLNCNPNVIEMLGTKQDQIYKINKYGKLLRDNVDVFLSKKAIHSFGGYATSQLRRLQNALARDNYPQSEKEKHILNSIKNQMRSLEDNYSKLNNGAMKLYLDNSDKDDFDKEIFMDLDLKHYPLRDFKAIHSEMFNVVKDYNKLNHRNSKKDELHLNKHAMHLIRLLEMGTEILEGKGVNTYRENKDFLLKIRDGQFSYEEIFDMVDKLEERFNYAGNNTILPNKPDYKKAEEILIEINKEVIMCSK